MGKHGELVRLSLEKVRDLGTGPSSQSWARRHHGHWQLKGPIPSMILACADYADTHEKRYESRVGDDGVLGTEWESIVRSVRGLLNGELNGLDGGTLDSLLCRMLEAEGFET